MITKTVTMSTNLTALKNPKEFVSKAMDSLSKSPIDKVGLAFLMPPNPTMVYPSWLNHHPRKELIRFENLFLRENK